MAAGLRIGFDLIVAGSGLEEGAGGADNYVQGLIPELAQDPRIDELIVYAPSWYEGAHWDFPRLRVVRCRVPKARPLRVGYEQLGLLARGIADQVDVLFSGGNYRPLLYRRCNVLGLHAIQHFVLGGDDVSGLRARYVEFTVPRSLRTADLTITVTETLRQDSIKLWSLDPERIVAVPMGPTPWVAELLSRNGAAPAAPYRLPDDAPYAMCISRLYSLKNHRRLIEAYAKLVQIHQVPHRLVIVGADADVTSQQLEEIARAAGVGERVLLLGRMPQADIPGLYAGASAIAYPSLYETFGHPVLEAFAAGTPLLTSSRGATAEVAGASARLVDPEDVDDIAAGLADVLLDDGLRRRLIEAGHERVREFSWQKCAKGTVDVFERAAERRREYGHPGLSAA